MWLDVAREGIKNDVGGSGSHSSFFFFLEERCRRGLDFFYLFIYSQTTQRGFAERRPFNSRFGQNAKGFF